MSFLCSDSLESIGSYWSYGSFEYSAPSWSSYERSSMDSSDSWRRHRSESCNSDGDDEFSEEIVDDSDMDHFSEVVACFKENTQDPLILAVLENDINSLMKLSDTIELNKFLHTETGDTLLHIAVRYRCKEAFHYVLSIPDFPLDQRNNDADTVLNLCFNNH